MKLSGRDAARFADAPDLRLCGVLFYGEDVEETARRRIAVTQAIIGASGDADMSATRMSAADVRRDPASVVDVLRARGFFGGRQVLIIEDAGDSVASHCDAALAEATVEDAFLIVTAGILPARSKLRKAFEAAGNAAAAPCFFETMDRAEIAKRLRDLGADRVSEDALRDLEDLARGLDKAAVRDLLTRLSLFAKSIERPISAGDVDLCAPAGFESGIDDILAAVAEGRAAELGPLMSRLIAQGQAATTIAIAASRHFQRIHAVVAAADSSGSLEAAVGGLRPPLFGPRRDAFVRHCRRWRLSAVESALSLLLETDRAIRGGSVATGYAILERAFLKLALTAQRM